MFSTFFINRPIFSVVIFIILTMAGVGFMLKLPLAQFPDIAPPTVMVNASYPGAIAEAAEKTVTIPLEVQINGVENMIYMSSVAANDGSSSTTVTFDVGSDTDMAVMNTLIRTNLAVLPSEVTRMGLSVDKQSPNILQAIAFQSPDKRYDDIYLSNYILVNVLDTIKRVPGVGDAQIAGSKDYSMRIWLNADRMAKLGLTTTDVAQALEQQNYQYPTGRIGMPPVNNALEMTYNITSKGRLVEPKEFENVILKADPENGSVIRIKDVGRVELGAEDYEFTGRLNGNNAVIVLTYVQPGANELAVAQAIQEAMKTLSKDFPKGITYSIPHDTTVFVQISIEEVVKTLFVAIILVFFVVYLFLQNWRATLIPIIAIPVSLIGTFVGMAVLGYSINTLTLFGMVLAIGMVVDDAIVVVENVERTMHEDKLPPKEATIKAMGEVTSPIIAIVCVLCSVFIPVAFLGGLTGKLYEQFAITIAVSMVISGFTALTLSPALAALLLRPSTKPPLFFLRKFNIFFEKTVERYGKTVALTIKRSLIAFTLFFGVLLAIAQLFNHTPSSLVPEEDQGYLITVVKMPDGSTINRTLKTVEEVEAITKKIPAVENTISLVGFDFLTGQFKPNAASLFVRFTDWKKREAPELQSKNLLKQLLSMTSHIKEGTILAFAPPPIPGLGKTGGSEFYIEDRGGHGVKELETVVTKFIAEAKKRPEIAQVSTTLRTSTPQYFFKLDEEKVQTLGVSVKDVYSILNAFFGSYYVNDFNYLGRVFHVKLQGESRYRAQPKNLEEIYVRSQTTQAMIPLNTLCSLEQTTGPEQIDHYNAYEAAYMNATSKPGYSAGQSVAALEAVAKKTLPDDMRLSWTGTVFQSQKSGSKSAVAFIFGFIMVVLILAAQYEKIILPLSVLLSVPFGILGALIAVSLRGLENDIYFQIGLLTLVGLSAKNAILIVEFAIVGREQHGLSIIDAAVHAAKIRFRPIVMTSLAFILGTLPLALSKGAGASSRHSIGTGIVGGMIAATFLAIFFIPLFFERAQSLSEYLKRFRTPQSTPLPPAPVDLNQ